jgi:hypothetical protein
LRGKEETLTHVALDRFLFLQTGLCHVKEIASMGNTNFRQLQGWRTWAVGVCCFNWSVKEVDRLCGPVVRVPGYRSEMYCASCEVRTEFICYVEESRQPLLSSGQSSCLQIGDVLCFLWRTNWIYICYIEESRPPLWSSGQSSWLHNEDVLCFLWGMNWIYICYVEESRPPLRSRSEFLATDPEIRVRFPALLDFSEK